MLREQEHRTRMLPPVKAIPSNAYEVVRLPASLEGDRQYNEQAPLLSSIQSLQKVRSPLHMGYYASANHNFAGAHFTRDGVKAARDMLDAAPRIAEETIMTVIKFQATADDIAHPLRDAAHIGDAHHEHRDRKTISRLHLPPDVKKASRKILQKLGNNWGGIVDAEKRYKIKKINEVTYYGAADTTPEAARLIATYNERYPEHDVLNKVVKRKKESVTVKEGYLEALSAIVLSISESDLGLREFSMRNPMGIKNKFWKDSASSLLFSNGETANYTRPIAEISVQGITYDALKKSSTVLTHDEINSIVPYEKVKRVLAKEKVKEVFEENELAGLVKAYENLEINGMDVLAKVIQQQVLRRMWNKDSQYFTPALDRDPKTDNLRKLDTLASNPAALLNTTIFDDVSEDEKIKYIGGIAKVIMSSDFLTPVGIRGRSLKHYNIVPFSDYHGAGTVWAKETFDIAEGFEKHGFYHFAEQLRYRVINSVNIAGANFEFFYVDEGGNVNYDPHGKRSYLIQPVTEKHIIYGTNIPEPDQTWTETSVNKAKRIQRDVFYHRKSSTGWQAGIENMLIQQGNVVPLLKTRKEIEAAYPKHIYHVIDIQRGKELDGKFNKAWWDMENKKRGMVA